MDTGALAEAVETRIAPRLELARALTAAVEKWIAAERACVVAEAIRAIKPAWCDQEALRLSEAAVKEMQALVATLAPPAKPAAPEPATVARPVRPTPQPKRAASIIEKKNADRLIAEIARVDVEQHHLRLLPLLRMLASEVRSCMHDLSPSDATYGRLFDQLDILRRLRRQSGVGHVYGLEISEQHDFDDLAQRARRQLDRYDRDAGTPLRLVAGRRR